MSKCESSARSSKDGQHLPPNDKHTERRLPDFNFSGIRFEEAARRQAILADIERRMEKDGAHTAVASPHRARQFMPFAALDGFTELIKKTEGESMQEEEPSYKERPANKIAGLDV